MKGNILKEKSFGFAIRIIELYKFLKATHQEYILSKQILRCGTAIGAQIREAEFAESTKDFIHKFSVGLKEANETKYWLELLVASQLIEEKLFRSFVIDCDEILKLLIASINTSKKKLSN